jgi:putative oxidoreductase
MTDDPARARRAMTALRWVLSLLIFVHGAYRISVGGVPGFGEWLGSLGLPAGPAIAWTISLMELLGTPVLAWGRFQRPLALWYAGQLIFGVILVHAPEGWFVVGGGRNGVEYSVLLVSGFLLTAWVAPPMRRPG